MYFFKVYREWGGNEGDGAFTVGNGGLDRVRSAGGIGVVAAGGAASGATWNSVAGWGVGCVPGSFVGRFSGTEAEGVGGWGGAMLRPHVFYGDRSGRGARIFS